ncbi:MAG: dipeptide ABC transporter ATP-binding protein [Gammaproteobacteria bacterium]|jgi:peptide/nickel transport system ATP-binding protein
MTTPLLEVHDLRTWLHVSGRLIKAVDGVDFEVRRGETFCLVGESGSGKSVTALSILQLLPPDRVSHPTGRILLHDAGGQDDILAMDESSRCELRGGRIAMIFQEPMTCLNPVMTVGDQIGEALSLHRDDLHPDHLRVQVIESLRAAQIDHPEQRFSAYPHQLSGGQRQRAMIAMALACEPDLLIADEPTTALDVTVQAGILELMKSLQAEKGMSILFITHDLGVVAQVADRVAVMRAGKIVEQGEADDVLYSPRHDYTRQLIDALPENLPRTPRGHDGATPLIELQDLYVHFPVRKGILRRVVDHVKAVDGVSLQINQGEVLALVGESGCGKTTMGRALLGLQPVTRGNIRFHGRDLQGLRASSWRGLRRHLQIVFQDPMSSLNPRLTIAQALIEPMRVHGIGENEEDRLERARSVLRQVRLEEDSLWQLPQAFSGGQRQRIGIARALVLEPDFLLCDEITSALDVSVQAELLQLLLELKRERGLTLMFITHNIAVVEYISDRTAVMRDGRIIEVGETARVCGSPRDPYTRSLLAAVPRLYPARS